MRGHHIEAPWLGGVDVTSKGSSVFSFCARLAGVLLPWAGRGGMGCRYGVVPVGCLCRGPRDRSGKLVALNEDGGPQKKNEFLLHGWVG